MKYEIKKDYKLNKCVEIFENNRKNFVFDKASITSPNYVRFVCVLNDEPIGYAVVYEHNDFLIREDFNCPFTPEPNAIYIWHTIVHSDFCGIGVGKFITKSILNEYARHPVYCVVDKSNEASLALHKSLNFEVASEFKENFHNTDTDFVLLRHI